MPKTPGNTGLQFITRSNPLPSRNLPPNLTLLWRLVVAMLPSVLFTLQSKVDGTLGREGLAQQVLWSRTGVGWWVEPRRPTLRHERHLPDDLGLQLASVQVRTSPSVTGMESLTSMVNRKTRLARRLFSGSKNFSFTSQQSLSSRQIGLFSTVIVSSSMPSPTARVNVEAAWKALVAEKFRARSREVAPRFRRP